MLEDIKMTDAIRALLTISLKHSTRFMDGLMKIISVTCTQLNISRCLPKKAWHLITVLNNRILENVCESRIEVLGKLNTRKSVQVTSVTFFAYLQSQELTKEHGGLKFANYPPISSEHIKFLCHDFSY